MRLALIDLSNIFWSSYHATAGQDVDAAFRVSTERTRAYADGYDAVVVCCDIGRTWRHEIYSAYKANRPPRDAAAYDQLRRVREQLEAEGVPVVAAEGFEADDVIATLACKAPAHGYEVTIVSADKDLCQLIGPSIRVQSTSQNATLYDAAKVEEKFRVPPSLLGDWLALVGDKSDNIMGLPGCGEVNAARLLNELGSLQNMLNAPDGVTPQKMRDALLANRAQVILARKLVELRVDVPIDFAEAIKPRARKPAPEKLGEPPDEEDHGSGPTTPKEPERAPPNGHDDEKRPSDRPKANGNGNGGTSSALVVAPRAAVLDRSDPRWTLALEPQSLKQLWWFCEQIHQGGLYRKFANEQAIMSIIMRGRSMGIAMMDALDLFNLVNGKPTLGSMAVVGRCLASGKAEYFDMLESERTYSIWETRRVGRPRPTTLRFDLDEAEERGMCRPSKRTGEPSNWVIQPKQMCRKQCAIELARAVYPDITANLHDPDEIEPR